MRRVLNQTLRPRIRWGMQGRAAARTATRRENPSERVRKLFTSNGDEVVDAVIFQDDALDHVGEH